MKTTDERDDGLVKAVAQALYDTPDLAVTGMRVDMLDGTVVVVGTVSSTSQVELARQAVASFPQAREIEIRIRVDERDPGSGSDTADVSLGAGPDSGIGVGSI